MSNKNAKSMKLQYESKWNSEKIKIKKQNSILSYDDHCGDITHVIT